MADEMDALVPQLAATNAKFVADYNRPHHRGCRRRRGQSQARARVADYSEQINSNLKNAGGLRKRRPLLKWRNIFQRHASCPNSQPCARPHGWV